MSSPLDDQPSDPHLADPAPTTTPPTRAATRRTALAGAAGAGAILALTGLAAGPRPARLGDVHGDAELAAALRPHLGGHRHVSAVVSDGGQQRFAGFGADETTEFEIGSVTKTFTGALLAVAVEEGELELTTTVGEILGEQAGTSALSGTTLAALASHTSGLPRLALTSAAGAVLRTLLRKDPYLGVDADRLVADALAAPLSEPGTAVYSNLGVALLGQLLARAAGTDYASLLSTRILRPLQLSATAAAISPNHLPADAPRGRGASGLPQAPWTMDGSAPAGGIRSTATDMVAYLTATMDGSAPGASAPEVQHTDPDGRRTALCWMIEDLGGGSPVTWHNGGTGGFSSFVGWNPEARRGVVLLADSARSLDDLGAVILNGEVAA